MTPNSIFDETPHSVYKSDNMDKSSSQLLKPDFHLTPAIALPTNQPLKIIQPRKLEPINRQEAVRRHSFAEQEILRLRDLFESESPEKLYKDFEEMVAKNRMQEAKIKELEDLLVIEQNEKQNFEQQIEDLNSLILKLNGLLAQERDKTKKLEKEVTKAMEKIKSLENPNKSSNTLSVKNEGLLKRKTTKIDGFDLIPEENPAKVMKRDLKKYGIITAFIRKLMIFLTSHKINASDFIKSLDPDSKDLFTYEEFQVAIQRVGFRSALNELQTVFDLLKIGEQVSISSLHSQLQSAIDKESDHSSDISSPPSIITPNRGSFTKMSIVIPDTKVKTFLEDFEENFDLTKEDVVKVCEKVFPDEVRFEHMIKLFLTEEIHIEDSDLRKKLASHFIGGKEIVNKKDAIEGIIEKLFGEKDQTPGFHGEITEPILAQIEFKRDEFLNICRDQDSQKIGILSFNELVDILAKLNIKISDSSLEQFISECSAKFASIDQIEYENLLRVKSNSYNRGFSFAS
mmetsp:Transcript_30451/g.30104  ORF Transcript_30451/g.30104 Transcript_30451/m.30104 type:complete len:514 (+) Transcript_30451:219-1760(+)